MDPVALLERIVGSVVGLARSAWQRRRFGARVAIALGWEHLPIMTIPGPNPRWRAVTISITAPKTEELVVAEGIIEAKPGGRGAWVKLARLSQFLTLPL